MMRSAGRAETTAPLPRVDVRYRIAAWLVITQAIAMELGATLALPLLLLSHVSEAEIGTRFHFALPYLQNNLPLLMVMSGIFGVLRLAGGIGILRDRLWGLAVTVVMIVVTLVLMIFLLPAGIADGLFSGASLLLIAGAWFGRSTLSEHAAAGCRLPDV